MLERPYPEHWKKKDRKEKETCDVSRECSLTSVPSKGKMKMLNSQQNCLKDKTFLWRQRGGSIIVTVCPTALHPTGWLHVLCRSGVENTHTHTPALPFFIPVLCTSALLLSLLHRSWKVLLLRISKEGSLKKKYCHFAFAHCLNDQSLGGILLKTVKRLKTMWQKHDGILVWQKVQETPVQFVLLGTDLQINTQRDPSNSNWKCCLQQVIFFPDVALYWFSLVALSDKLVRAMWPVLDKVSIWLGSSMVEAKARNKLYLMSVERYKTRSWTAYVQMHFILEQTGWNPNRLASLVAFPCPENLSCQVIGYFSSQRSGSVLWMG